MLSEKAYHIVHSHSFIAHRIVPLVNIAKMDAFYARQAKARAKDEREGIQNRWQTESHLYGTARSSGEQRRLLHAAHTHTVPTDPDRRQQTVHEKKGSLERQQAAEMQHASPSKQSKPRDALWQQPNKGSNRSNNSTLCLTDELPTAQEAQLSQKYKHKTQNANQSTFTLADMDPGGAGGHQSRRLGGRTIHTTSLSSVAEFAGYDAPTTSGRA